MNYRAIGMIACLMTASACASTSHIGPVDADKAMLIPGSDVFLHFEQHNGARCHLYPHYFIVERGYSNQVENDILVKYLGTVSPKPICEYLKAPQDLEVKNIFSQYFFGIRGSLLFIDDGSGPDPRGLKVYDLNSRKKVFSGIYSRPIVITGDHSVRYWLERGDATEEDCPEYSEIKKHALFPYIEDEVTLNLSTKSMKRTGRQRCVGGQ